MDKLEKIWLNVSGIKDIELRLDWTNDRHQAILLESLSPEDVQKGFKEAILMIEDELHNGYLRR